MRIGDLGYKYIFKTIPETNNSISLFWVLKNYMIKKINNLD